MKELTAWTLAIALLTTCVQAQAQSEAAAPAADIWTAAAKGNIEAIKRKLSVAANVKTEGESGVTPLFVAALFGRAEAAKLLIERGADVKMANAEDGATALHAAAFFCHTDTVELLLTKGADINALNRRSETPLDTVAGPWSGGLGELYAGIAKAIGMELDLKRIETTRPTMAALLRERGGRAGPKPAAAPGPGEKPVGNVKDVAALGLRCSYYVNGEIHVNELGTPEGKPLTSGHWDFKPSWSKAGDMLVFFRRLQDDPVVTNWVTAICVIKVDGTGFHQLTDGTHTDFNQTWTRDGLNTPIWNRKNPETGGFIVMQSKVGNRPGQEVALTDKRYHTWAYTCLKDGRILVQCSHPKQGWGYFLMTPKAGGKSRFERIDCELAKKGLLDRVSVSPSEERVCFEYQTGFKYKDMGRTLYIADFDARKRTITNAKPIANEEAKPNPWYAYPRWTKDETAVVYHANKTGKGALYLYTLKDGSTKKVSTNPRADYRYPHGEKSPK